MKIQQLAMDRVMNIHWFYNSGKPWAGVNYLTVSTSKEAMNHLASNEWENATLEESNKISGFLSVKEKVIFQEWNNLIKEAKLFFKRDVVKNIPQLEDIDDLLLQQCIEWDVAHFLVEDAYSNKLKKPLFFEGLISIYEIGRLPCGWLGTWPNGNVVVY